MTASPQRLIQIISKPGRQTYVPSTPEVGRIGRKIWEIKIKYEFKPHYFRDPSGDIRVSRKITIDLKGKRNDADSDFSTTWGRLRENVIDDRREIVGNDCQIVPHNIVRIILVRRGRQARDPEMALPSGKHVRQFRCPSLTASASCMTSASAVDL